MSKNDFEFLSHIIEPKVKKMDTSFREAITVKERLAITLRFLATGDSYTSLQYLFRVSKQSISKIIPEVCEALMETLQEYIKVPSTTQEWLSIAKEFEEKWNFPHVIGAIDGKHVMLQVPINSGAEYYNYKHFFSIVLFALVDAKYNFIYVDIGCQGRMSDGGIFKNTNLYKKLEEKSLNTPSILQEPYSLEIPYFIVGDKAFALNEYTMRPFEGNPEAGSIERIFNYRLSRARRVVENAFGIISSVFRVLRKPILLEPEIAKKVVMTIICIHNFLRKRPSSQNYYTPTGSFDIEEVGQVTHQATWRRDQQESSSLFPIRSLPRRGGNYAKNIRLHLATHFITNGTVPWQHNY